jgi:hypothetical protein
MGRLEEGGADQPWAARVTSARESGLAEGEEGCLLLPGEKEL